MFKDIAEAYQVLTDKDKKRKYDLGQDLDGQDFEGFGGGGVDPRDIFKMFFGGGGSPFGGGDEEMPDASQSGSGRGRGGHGHSGFSSFPGGFGNLGGGRGGNSFTFKFG